MTYATTTVGVAVEFEDPGEQIEVDEHAVDMPALQPHTGDGGMDPRVGGPHAQGDCQRFHRRLRPTTASMGLCHVDETRDIACVLGVQSAQVESDRVGGDRLVAP